MNWISNFQSSDMHSFRWVEGDEYPLEIRFHRRPSGHTDAYRYKDVPKSKFDGLKSAKSKAKYS